MKKIRCRTRVSCSALAMYEVVNTVSQYPAFVPWCTSVEILSQTPERAWVRMHFAKGLLRGSLCTRNRLSPGIAIDMELWEGPFSEFHGCWGFEDCEDGGAEVSFSLDFAFSSAAVAVALGPLFEPLTRRMLSVFCERAEVLYGAK